MIHKTSLKEGSFKRIMIPDRLSAHAEINRNAWKQ